MSQFGASSFLRPIEGIEKTRAFGIRLGLVRARPTEAAAKFGLAASGAVANYTSARSVLQKPHC